jgi:2'-5' RNA ligase/GNAT superfamily N-acetyltransferase
MPRLRLGVVLLVPPPVDREVDALRRACGDASLGRVPAHLTLVPPVNVRKERLGDVLSLLRAAGAAIRPFRLDIGPPTTFLPDNPVLYLPVAGEAAPLHALRDRVFVEPLARELTWPFVPHVTLVDGGEPGRLEAAVTALADARYDVPVDRVTLLQEQRDDEGARVWRPIADAALAAPAVVGRGGLELELATGPILDAEAGAWRDGAWAAYTAAEYGPGAPEDDPLAVTGRRSGQVVGVAVGHVRGPDAYLAELIVGADVRGEGVGGHLLAAFAAEARSRGATELTLRTIAGGAADRFYRERGFTPAFPLPGWRHGRDFVQLRRQL